MKSQLRFKLERERCLELLKEVTNETNTSSITSSFSNFDSIVKGKKFYGKFYDDNSFDLQPTTYSRGSMGPILKGRMEDFDDGEYKCHIQVEGKVPKWS